MTIGGAANRHRLARIAIALLAAACLLPAGAWAGPADPTPFVMFQPDGTPIVARAAGDEWANATETLAGFTIIRDTASGFWVYANRAADGSLVGSGLVAGRDQPAGMIPHLLPNRTQAPTALDAGLPPLLAPAIGSRKTLVLLVQFANKTAVTTPAQWQSRFFGATASVTHHYSVSSYGQVTIAPASESSDAVNDGIVGWLSLPTNHPNTGQATGPANQQLTKDAILAADPYVNFAAFDTNGNGQISPSELMIVVIAAGNETSYGGSGGSCSPSVWGHKWQVSGAPSVDGVVAGGLGYAQFGEMHCFNSNPPGQIATIGIMAHELGHLFGLPDLYDTATPPAAEGVGEWSLMSGGSWNGVSRSGDSPSLLDPWSKYFLGWVTPTIVSGTFTNQGIPASAANNIIFQFRSGSALTGTGEYFLLENRQKTSYDTPLPGAGLLIWHIDESRSGNSAECIPGGTPVCTSTVHYKVAVIQADAGFNLERGQNRGDTGDPYPGASGKRSLTDVTWPSLQLWNATPSGAAITDISDSGPVMTATLSMAAEPLGSFSKTTPANGATNQPVNLTLAWSASSGAVGYDLCVDTVNNNVCDVGPFMNVGNVTSLPIDNYYEFGLASGTTYYWQVQAKNGGGTLQANGGTWWSFATPLPAPGSFAKIAPAEDAINVPTNATLSWGTSSFATSYQYCLDTTSDNACSPWTSVGTNTSVAPGGLATGTTYYWQVRAVNGTATTQANGGYGRFSTETGQLPDAYEPDQHVLQASKLAGSQAHTFHLNTDQDWASFAGMIGQQLTIETSNLTASADTVLYIYDWDGTTERAVDDNSGAGLASRVVFNVPLDGKYYVKVVQAGATGAGAYTLTLTSNTTAAPDVFEADNTPAQASSLSPGGTQAHTFHVNGDVDWTAIPVVWGHKYIIETETAGADTVVTLYGPDGTSVISSDDDGGATMQTPSNSRLPFTAVHTGTYYIKTTQFGGQGNGAYTLKLSVGTTNLVENGKFDAATLRWLEYATPTQNYMFSSGLSGVYQFYRVVQPGVSNQAVVFQPLNSALPVGTPIVVSALIGNSDTVRKRISLLVHDADFSDLFVCTFWLPANAPLATYGMRTHTTKAWANATISFYAASANQPGNTTGFYRLDDVSVTLDADGASDATGCEDPTAPPPSGGADGPNLIANGNFSGGLSSWTTFGQITSQVTGGVFQFVKNAGSPAGVLLQATGQAMTANQILTASFQLGNSSAVRKRVTVILHDLNFSDLSACTFWLEPNQPLATYAQKTFSTQAWTNATLSIYPATVGADQWILFDDATLRRTPSAAIGGNTCLEPPSGSDAVSNLATRPATTGLESGAEESTGAGAHSAEEWRTAGFVSSVGGAGWVASAANAETVALERNEAIDLTGAARATLTLQSWLSTVASRAFVQASTDGVTWETVSAVAASDTWVPVEIDLSAYAGSTLRLRFTFVGQAWADATTPDTWRIEAVAVSVVR